MRPVLSQTNIVSRQHHYFATRLADSDLSRASSYTIVQSSRLIKQLIEACLDFRLWGGVAQGAVGRLMNLKHIGLKGAYGQEFRELRLTGALGACLAIGSEVEDTP